ncbi:DUF2523 family protein [Curvibacter sp. HBC28]|uniref:DUF2523 family protein n=1 Tax=Curvibacter microcysteis TaxID=3026419 RepID=A0ABT5MLI3_9BURK|nr:DUF2523 family protein [Curvibacter sp. HBC28]MDD0817255.1 DUF2523 family protein [Curvibacter sp. HBC28]
MGFPSRLHSYQRDFSLSRLDLRGLKMKRYIQFLAALALPAWAFAQDSGGSSSSGFSFSVADLLTPLFTALAKIVAWVLDLAKSVLVAVLDLLKDLFCWVFDQFLGVVESALSAIDVSAFNGLGDLTAALPATVVQVLAAVGAGQALAMIVAALGIRFALQLIPFVRLGS